MLRKIKNVVIKIFCFLWVSSVCSIGAIPKEEAGVGMNGFLAFGLWVLCIFITIKIKPWIAASISTVVVTVVGIANSEITWAGFWKSIELPLGTLLITGMLIKLFLGAIDEWEDESNARNERKKNAQKRGEAYCPWCGSVSIQYYPLGIPYQDYVDSPIQRLNQKYHCNNCGRQW